MEPCFLARFAITKRGNLAILSALFALPTLVLAGGTVDIMRVTEARSEVSGALDEGTIAAISLAGLNDPEIFIREYLDANLDARIIDPASINLDVSAEKLGRYSSIEVAANFTVDTQFVDLIGLSAVPVAVRSAATHSSDTSKLP